MSLKLNFNRAYALLYVFCILASGLFLTCSNESDDDDILTASYDFTNACDDSMGTGICTNRYPDDGLPFPCGTTGPSIDTKCPNSGVLGVCSRIPKTWEKVYYSAYGDVTAAMNDCSSIGQTSFSTVYNP